MRFCYEQNQLKTSPPSEKTLQIAMTWLMFDGRVQEYVFDPTT
jgi:hypothetical protein